MRTRILSIALTAFALMGSAYATVTFTQGSNTLLTPNTTVQGIVSPPTPSMITTGMTNMPVSACGTPSMAVPCVVQFVSTTNNLTTNGTRITAASGNLENLTISLPGHAFGDFFMSVGLASPQNPVTITAHTTDNMTPTFTILPTGTGAAVDISLNVAGGEHINRVTLTSMGFAQVAGPIEFFAGPGAIIDQPEVPEPGTLGLLGTGLIGLAGMARRKLKLWT